MQHNAYIDGLKRAWKEGAGPLSRALAIVWRGAPKLSIVNVVLILLQALLPLLSLYLVKRLVDTISGSLSEGTAIEEATGAMWLLGLLGISVLVAGICRNLGTYVNEAQGQRVADYVQGLIHDKSVELELSYYESPEYFDHLHRAQREAPNRTPRVVRSMAQTTQSGISLVGVCGLLLLSFHWGIVVFLAAIGFVTAWVKASRSRKIYEWQREQSATQRCLDYYNWMLTAPYYAKEIRLFGLGRIFKERAKNVRERLRHQRLAISARWCKQEVVTSGISIAAMFGSIAYVARQAMVGAVSLGDLVMYYQAFQRALSNLQDFSRGGATLYEDHLFLRDFDEFLRIGCHRSEPARPKAFPRPLEKGIRFENVTFRYGDGGKDVIRNLDFFVRPGEKIALVGENGAGKTTIVKLLCGLFDPSEGRITFDGIDIREFSSDALRAEMSVIFQDFARFYMSAGENIWFGDVGREYNEAHVRVAARDAGIDKGIERLGRGFETVLGKFFPEGEELSIGQWQKVALARAFFRQPQVFVLDEPTSSLDGKGEYEVFERFYKLASGRTAVLISHRLSTVRQADLILVIKDGELIEKGTHEELTRKGGEYSRMFELQARQYR